MHSFRLRLFIGLLVVAVLAILFVTVLTSRGISSRFVTYVAGNEDAERQAIATVIEHQLQHEGPEGIGPLADVIGEVYERPITLTDTEGDVLFSTKVIIEEEIVEAGSIDIKLRRSTLQKLESSGACFSFLNGASGKRWKNEMQSPKQMG